MISHFAAEKPLDYNYQFLRSPKFTLLLLDYLSVGWN